jgi:four helix bundle protein
MSEKINSYKDLKVWKRGMGLVKVLYEITSHFPSSELYSLTNQIRRAAISVPVNIAEGWGRETTKNYIQFLRNSRGSLFELETLILVYDDLKYIEKELSCNIHKEIEALGKMLNSLIQQLNKKFTD